MTHPLKEDLQTEFKSSFGDGVIESLCAFANTHGGRVLIGISDDGKPVSGFFTGDETLQKWINEVKNKTRPSVIPDTRTIKIENKEVIELSVKEFPVKPVAFKGRYLKRVNNANHQLPLSEIADLHLRSFNTSWDSYINPGRDLNTLSLDKVNQFISHCNEGKLHAITDDPLTVLSKYELIRGAQVTNAGFLMFACNDVFQATIELGRFSTPTSIKDGHTVRSDLFSEVELVLDFIRKHINKSYIITGNPRREEQWQYPMDAIREIVINMIVHRDYMDSGDSSVKIYDDHIEFYNPGKLPDSISIEKLLKGDYSSWTRNRKIAAIFKEAQFIEKYGSGIKRIREGFNAHGLVPPVFENFQQGFRVIVHSKEPDDGVSGAVNGGVNGAVSGGVNLLLDLIEKHPGQKVPFFVTQTSIPGRTVQRWITKLKKENRVEFRGAPKTGGYWLKD